MKNKDIFSDAFNELLLQLIRSIAKCSEISNFSKSKENQWKVYTNISYTICTYIHKHMHKIRHA